MHTQVYLYMLAPVASHLHAEVHFLLFRLLFMTYHGIKDLNVLDMEAHMGF